MNLDSLTQTEHDVLFVLKDEQPMTAREILKEFDLFSISIVELIKVLIEMKKQNLVGLYADGKWFVTHRGKKINGGYEA